MTSEPLPIDKKSGALDPALALRAEPASRLSAPRGDQGESATLTLPLNGVYFDAIRSGDKLEEYRLVTPFWSKRLEGRSYGKVVLTRGYPKGGGIEGVTRLTRDWRGFKLRTITHPHFGPKPVEVYAIQVSPTPSPPITDGEV
jgi:hypothetical protein